MPSELVLVEDERIDWIVRRVVTWLVRLSPEEVGGDLSVEFSESRFDALIAVQPSVGGDLAWLSQIAGDIQEPWFGFANGDAVKGADALGARGQSINAGRDAVALECGRAVTADDLAVLQGDRDAFFERQVVERLKIRIEDRDRRLNLSYFLKSRRFHVRVLDLGGLFEIVRQTSVVAKVERLTRSTTSRNQACGQY